MTEQELVELEIERRALLHVVSEFICHNIDIRMSVQMDEFLSGLEKRAAEIQQIIDQHTR